MTEETQQGNVGSTGVAPDSMLGNCDDVQITTSDADLVIAASGEASFTVQVIVSGTNCRSISVCVWDGQKWVCTDG